MIELVPALAGAAADTGPAGAPDADRRRGHRGSPTAPVAGRPTHLLTDGVEALVRAVVDAAGQEDHDPQWGTFLGVDPDTHQVVGTCGYRGDPRSGRVEIAFWTFPPFEGRGWATAMAKALVARALAHPDVEVVLAHTLPERAPATSVLTAAGLLYTGTVRRDERSGPGATAVRGRVWRWERRHRGGW